MSGLRRRGACPSLGAPMSTGDGLLVRFSPKGGAMTPEALSGLADAALAFGNGVLEVTARGALQVRGLRADTVDTFERAVLELGVAVQPHPAIVAGPLAGLDDSAVADPRSIAGDLASRCSRLSLAPKVSVVVDGGGRLHLDSLSADVRLRAAPASEGVLWHLSVAGDAVTSQHLGALAASNAAEGAWRVLSLLASRGVTARARELPREALRGALRGLAMPSQEPGPRSIADPVGLHVLGSSSALGVAGAYCQIDAGALAAFAREALLSGSTEIRPAPGRALLALHLGSTAAVGLREAALGQGFVTDPSDPRRRVVACPGKPACASGEVASRALASELAFSAGELLDTSVTVHVSGCAKGCARSEPAAITLVGLDGSLGVVLNASAKGASLGCLPPEALSAVLQRLGETLKPLRAEGRNTAAAMALLGSERLTTILLGQVQ